MDRTSFKQRMQSLKTYREQNPGRGYWEWKAQQFDNGGETLPTRQAKKVETFKNGGPIMPLGVGWNVSRYIRQLFNKDERSVPVAKTMYYIARNSQMDPGFGLVVGPDFGAGADILSDEIVVDPGEVFFLSPENQKKEIAKNKDYRIIDITSEKDPYGVVRTAANYHKQKHGEIPIYEYIANSDTTVNKDNLVPILTRDNKQLQVPYLPHAGSYNSVLYIDKNTGNYYQRAFDLNDYGPSSSGDKGAASSYLKPLKWLAEKMDEMGTPFVQRTGFVPTPKNVYYYLSEEERELVDKTKKSLGLYKDGGEVEPPYPQFVNGQRVNRITGKPIATGQAKPLFDLEDFFNFTPVGDAITVKDTYDAAKQKDWSTAALAALTLIPFVPTTVKQFNRKYKGVTPKVKREIPIVNKNQVQEQINDIEKERLRRSRLINEADNQGYKIAERLMEDPAYIKRAAKVQKEYGDDYLTTYADILQAYNENPNLLMKSSLGSLQNGARARMEATSDAVRRHMNGGQFPGIGEYNYRIDPTNMRDLTGNVTDHEWNHYVDYLKNKQPDGQGSSNLFKRMSEDIKYSDDPLDIYYGKPTEQKAYMNQLREYMFQNRMISSRDEEVSKELLQDVLNNLTNRNMDSVVRASRRMNNMDNYTKWFNSIPLLGLGAIGINKYYNQQKEK